GRDRYIQRASRRDRVSIHAPAWGATSEAHRAPSVARCFNPRARVGRDRHWRAQLHTHVHVSIHAPAWGATAMFSPGAWFGLGFQSTRPRGARLPDVSPAP